MLVQLSLELVDPLAHLVGLSGRAALLGDLALEQGKLLLDVDKVENDVEHAGQQKGQEQRGAGQVHCGCAVSYLAFTTGTAIAQQDIRLRWA